MKLLVIATGYLPQIFSENLCNAKLVYAFREAGWEVDVISRKGDGVSYSAGWQDPWIPLKEGSYEISYQLGNPLSRMLDTLRCSLPMGVFPIEGIRWAKRALSLALKLHHSKSYDFVLTRSPSDIPHLVGYHLKKRTGIRWIANWNDPASHIWPKPYTYQMSYMRRMILSHCTERCLNEADVNTFPSPYLQRWFEKHYPIVSKSPNMIIPHIAMSESIMPKLPPPTSENDKYMRMCHCGNLSSGRDPELLFGAMKELIDEGYSKLRLDIIGTVNDHIKHLIAKYGLGDEVKFLGAYPYMQTLQHMSSYNVLVLLEAIMDLGYYFPSKLTDYIQLNKPILALSPAKGFVRDLAEKFGGIIAVDNADLSCIKTGLKQMYMAWQSGQLNEFYSPLSAYSYISAPAVIGMYSALFERTLS